MNIPSIIIVVNSSWNVWLKYQTSQVKYCGETRVHNKSHIIGENCRELELIKLKKED